MKRALRGKVDQLQFVDDRLLRLMRRFATPFRLLTGWDVERTLKVLDPVYNLLKGRPTDATLASTYWRKRGPVPSQPDPDRDGCGLLWCSPVVPTTGAHADVATSTSDVLLAHGFEPQMSVSLATERSAICVITISYDRHVPGEDARAMACYRHLTSTLLARGYPPYRLNVAAMDHLEEQADYADTMHVLKQALDPRGILAPGRYEPSAGQAPARRRRVVA